MKRFKLLYTAFDKVSFNNFRRRRHDANSRVSGNREIGRKICAIFCASLLVTLFCRMDGRSVKADTVTNTITVGSDPTAVAVNSMTGKIYVVNQASNTVTVIDGTTESTTTVAVGASPVAVAVNSLTNKIYVANGDGGSVTVIDGSNNSTATVTAGMSPNGVAVNPQTNKIYITNGDSNNVTIIDGAANSTVTLAVGTAPRSVEFNSQTNKIYVANQLDNSVTVIDGTNNSTAVIPVGTFPIALAVNPQTNKIYTANADSNNVTVIDGNDNSTENVAADSSPFAVAVNPATNKIYVANFSGNNVTVIDGGNNSTATVPTGSTPVTAVVNSVANKIYVANADSNTVTVIDGSDNTTQTLNTGLQPAAAAVNPTANKVYIANLEGSSVTVIAGTPPSTGTVSGIVTYATAPSATFVPFTTIDATGSIPLSTMTDANGSYSLSGFGSGAYTVTPSKSGQVNGISNLDASRIAQHIVGLVELNEFQLLAADTSGNGTVGALDAAYIAQYVASIANPGQTGLWKFLPSSRSYADVLTSRSNQDFSAILVGDVTGNWNPAGGQIPPFSFAASQADKRFTAAGESPAVTVSRQKQTAAEGSALTIDLRVTETGGAGILSYQFEVLFDAEAIEAPEETVCDAAGTISGTMTALCREVRPGVLRVVVFGAAALEGEGTLLKLRFRRTENGGAAKGLKIDNFIFNENSSLRVNYIRQI